MPGLGEEQPSWRFESMRSIDRKHNKPLSRWCCAQRLLRLSMSRVTATARAVEIADLDLAGADAS